MSNTMLDNYKREYNMSNCYLMVRLDESQEIQRINYLDVT